MTLVRKNNHLDTFCVLNVRFIQDHHQLRVVSGARRAFRLADVTYYVCNTIVRDFAPGGARRFSLVWVHFWRTLKSHFFMATEVPRLWPWTFQRAVLGDVYTCILSYLKLG
jgi:hypothetical protein